MEEKTKSSKITKLLCATIESFEAKEVFVEVQFSRGLPSFTIVGLPSTEIKESKDRIKSALSCIDFKFPPSKITINLSPSEINKKGSHFDLSIAMGIALGKKYIDLKDTAIFGELGLDGSCKDTYHIFALVLSLATKSNIKKFIVPKNSLQKLSYIPNISLLAVESLQEALLSLENGVSFFQTKDIYDEFEKLQIGKKEYFYQKKFSLDFSDMKAQTRAKRALLIAASGFHNIIMEGSPGCGKSMGAKRLRYILPPMSKDEILSTAMLSSLDNDEPVFLPVRNFRSPHHSSSRASIFGGGSGNEAKIGEISLSNFGELFFDEITMFQKNVLESLREPLENHKIDISRVNTKATYDADFLFVAALNPCPCGNLFSSKLECKCSEFEIKRYKNRLSSPILDRIDLYIQMDESSSSDEVTTNSHEMFESVLKAFEMQKNRSQKSFNSRMSEQEIEKFCSLSVENEDILKKAVDNFGLSHRAKNKILKVARTIADIQESDMIEKSHLLEALSYRRR